MGVFFKVFLSQINKKTIIKKANIYIYYRIRNFYFFIRNIYKKKPVTVKKTLKLLENYGDFCIFNNHRVFQVYSIYLF